MPTTHCISQTDRAV